MASSNASMDSKAPIVQPWMKWYKPDVKAIPVTLRVVETYDDSQNGNGPNEETAECYKL